MKRRGVLPLIPLLLWTFAFVVIPMVYVLVLSVSTADGYGARLEFHPQNYARFFEAANLEIFASSLWIACLTTVLCLLIGYPFALCMATTRRQRTRDMLLMLVMLPFWTSALMRIFGWRIILQTNGLLNDVLTGTGIISGRIKFLYTRGAVLFGETYSMLPFMILPLYDALSKQDASLVEASRDLGAGRLKAFLTVTLPLSVPGIVSGVVLVFVPSVGLFFISDLMGGGTQMLLGNLISFYLKEGRDWPMGAALSMVMVVITFISMGIYRRHASGSGLGVLG